MNEPIAKIESINDGIGTQVNISGVGKDVYIALASILTCLILDGADPMEMAEICGVGISLGVKRKAASGATNTESCKPNITIINLSTAPGKNQSSAQNIPTPEEFLQNILRRRN